MSELINDMRWLACVLLFICAICDANDDLGAYTACRYSYDSTGNRTEKDCDGPKTTYRWDGRGNLLETSTSAQTIRYEWSSDNRQNGGAWQETRYTHTPDGVGQLISEQRQGQTLHVYEDGQGSARLITDEGGQIIETLDFDAFGNEPNPDPASPTRHRYTGESYDSATGLYHLRARDYDPKTGRFISMDEHPGSQSIPLTLNKYLYGNADPVNHIDPSGNFGLGGFSFSGTVSSFATMSNLYTVASISFDIATGNYAGAAEDLASELICARFGKALCGLVKKQLGIFFKGMKVNVKKLRLGNSRADAYDLDINMREVGLFRPPGTQAHHIVGNAYPAGIDAKALLQKYKIDINSPLNGVYLPGCKSSMRGTVHCGVHTEKYADMVIQRLRDAEIRGGRSAILIELDDLRRELQSGILNLNSKGVNK